MHAETRHPHNQLEKRLSGNNEQSLARVCRKEVSCRCCLTGVAEGKYWKPTYMSILLFVCSPQCELRLNLIHSYDGMSVLDTSIFRAAMPLTHLKVLFCKTVNINALLKLSTWYSDTLKSLIWIDSIDRKQLMRSESATSDPTDPTR